MGRKITNLVEGVEILLPVKFRCIPFSGFRGEVENVSARQRPGRPSCFSDRPPPKKNPTNLVKGVEILRPVKLPRILYSGFREVENVNSERRTTDKRTDDGQRVITMVHLSLRLRCTKNVNLGYSFLTRRGRASILQMYIPCDMTFPGVPTILT